jgi:hypothetical protein
MYITMRGVLVVRLDFSTLTCSCFLIIDTNLNMNCPLTLGSLLLLSKSSQSCFISTTKFTIHSCLQGIFEIIWEVLTIWWFALMVITFSGIFEDMVKQWRAYYHVDWSLVNVNRFAHASHESNIRCSTERPVIASSALGSGQLVEWMITVNVIN